jgi:hypothetical protein
MNEIKPKKCKYDEKKQFLCAPGIGDAGSNSRTYDGLHVK